MSYFNGLKLRQLRESQGFSMGTMSALTGVAVPTISKIETGKIDPRISTITRLLSALGKSLADLEPTPPETVTLTDLLAQSARAAEEIDRTGLGASDPWARLDRKDQAGIDTSAEREVLAAGR